MMKRTLCNFIVLVLCTSGLFAQVAINKTGAAPDPSAVLEVSSTDAGVLIPRMQMAQRVEILSPPDGLVVYQTDGNKDFYYSRAGIWYQLNQKQAIRNEVIMGASPIFTPSGTFSATLVTAVTNGLGVMTVTHPDYAPMVPVKMLTPVYNEIPSPPVIPNDLCKPNFNTDCAAAAGRYQFHSSVGIFSPALGGAIPVSADVRLCHKTGSSYPSWGGYCNDNSGNYSYLGTSSSFPAGSAPCFGSPIQTSIYNNNAGIPPGQSYEIFLRGNGYTSNNFNYYNAHSVFVDWNQDADFFDAGENIYAGPLYYAGAISNTYFGVGHIDVTSTVPPQAVTGNCTMRIITSMIANNNQPCLVTQFGSTADYDFKVASGAAPTYPAQNRFCNVSDETTSSFKVRCYDSAGTPVNAKLHILIQPF
jgi:hypothetical protein